MWAGLGWRPSWIRFRTEYCRGVKNYSGITYTYSYICVWVRRCLYVSKIHTHICTSKYPNTFVVNNLVCLPICSYKEAVKGRVYVFGFFAPATNPPAAISTKLNTLNTNNKTQIQPWRVGLRCAGFRVTHIVCTCAVYRWKPLWDMCEFRAPSTLCRGSSTSVRILLLDIFTADMCKNMRRQAVKLR